MGTYKIYHGISYMQHDSFIFPRSLTEYENSSVKQTYKLKSTQDLT